MSITAVALKRSRFTVVAALALFLAGLSALFDFPSTEEPFVQVRAATVEAYMPGATSERTEQLVAKPIEERLREVAEIKTLETTVRPGAVFIAITLHDGTPAERLPAIWQRVRVKLEDLRAQLPDGMPPILINDEFARVAVRSLALTGKGFSAGQLQDWARIARERLQTVSGVERISLHGVREERVFVDLDPARLGAAGLSYELVAQHLTERNVVAAAGEIDTGRRLLALEPSGELPNIAALASVPIPLGPGRSLPLGALARISQEPVDPPQTAVVVNGAPAVVLGISMRSGLNVLSFAERLDERIAELAKTLPAGMQLTSITDQAQVVEKDLTKVGQTFIETVVVVMLVVVLFLGWRAGFVTGVIVPMTVMGTLVAMRLLGIELHMVSIAAVIISLGLFVDNGIVVVEDYQRRLALGQAPTAAAEAAGRTMAAPLLTSSLAIIFAFAPLAAGSSDTAEYMRSLAIVLAITLLLSLFLALTLIPLLSRSFAGAHDGSHEDKGWLAHVRRWYEGRVGFIIQRPRTVVAGMAGLLVLSLGLFATIPPQLLAASARPQLQIPVELPVGASTRASYQLALDMSGLLADRRQFPEIVGNAIYVNDGGPRFILGLNPPPPAPHRIYALVNLAKQADLPATQAKLRRALQSRFPDARIEPKRFSLGVSEAGTAALRLTGPDRNELERGAAVLKQALGRIGGIVDIRDDAEGRIPRLVVDVDQGRALAAGVSSAAVARALETVTAGRPVTALRQGDVLVPVLLRGSQDARTAPERLAALPVFGPQGAVPLGQIAKVRIASQPSVLVRRDQSPALTVTARHPELSSQEIVDAIAADLAKLQLASGHTVELGGEIEESETSNASIKRYFPFALLGMMALFLWQFGSVRKTAIIMASIPFVLIGASLGLKLSGEAMSFTATLGLLALAGIIVNNAVLLLERIQEEREAGLPLPDAVATAAAVRLRPIVMTKLACIMGLVPLYLFGGDLWRPMAAAMIGGLALGTLITLVLIPALYALLFRDRLVPAAA
ncbi:efflux RND transporter permease subunit [Novosphingobium piscinae]|uniref:Efflux RND transporter permease subunit n=1 Tax=Novosphingobium piscinae TaxID=1507448 RepID=A0A7X1KNV6_9SPHN|nr:efflux RND transporter permease subunit [Novosphingobium piscinae]MBC2667843.1 efflux RND transporter permease subunit [Novosphingobium piscinae]